jgi:cell division protein FtsQ
LNLLADALLIFSIVALAYAALVGVQRLPVFPLRQLLVVGSVKQVTPTQVEYAVRNSVTGNFFTISLDTVRASFEKLPWVRHAEVRRIWPDGIEVSIEEQVAAARWHQADGEYRLVNTFGEVFTAANESDLPVFSGPEGGAPQMLARQQEFTRALAALGRQPQEMYLSLRQAWQVKLDNGLLLVLGRDETAHPVSERMARFVAAYPELEQKLHFRPGMIDMRYPNGFAVRAAHT